MSTPNYDMSNSDVKGEEIGHRAWHVFVGPIVTAPVEDQLKSGIRVLKIGGSAGYWTAELAKTYPSCKIDLVNKHNNYPTQNAPASVTFHELECAKDKLPFTDATFDLVVVHYILQRTPAAQWNHVFDELFRVLKPGGYLEVCDSDMIMNPNEGSNRVVNEAVAKGCGAMGLHYNTRAEIPKHLTRLGLTTVSEKNAPWYIDSEECPDFFEAMKPGLQRLGPALAKTGAMEESDYRKHIGELKANARAQKSHYYCSITVARK